MSDPIINSNIPPPQNPPDNGDMHERVDELNKALKTAKEHILDACIENKLQVGGLFMICVIIIIVGICFASPLMNYKLPEGGTTQAIYAIFTRAILVSAAFYVASFFFRLLKSYLHIHQRNSHRLMIINSMASLVATSSEKEETRHLIHSRLSDIIINFDKTGILNKEDDLKINLEALKPLFDSVKTLTKGGE